MVTLPDGRRAMRDLRDGRPRYATARPRPPIQRRKRAPSGKGTTRERRPLTPFEIRRLFDDLANRGRGRDAPSRCRDAALVALLVGTDLSPAAVRGLHLKDLDRLRMPLELWYHVLWWIRQRRRAHVLDAAPVLCTLRSDPLDPGNARSALLAVGRRCGLRVNLVRLSRSTFPGERVARPARVPLRRPLRIA